LTILQNRLHNIHWTYNSIRFIKSRRTAWKGNVPRTVGKVNAYRVVVETHEGKKSI